MRELAEAELAEATATMEQPRSANPARTAAEGSAGCSQRDHGNPRRNRRRRGRSVRLRTCTACTPATPSDKRWQTEILNISESEKGGFKEVVFEIRGEGAYSRLKYESGVHRVQRVPETEAQGRIHTSTATVAVLPEAEEVDVNIEEKDMRVDIFHSSGAGGQNVNKVATAVRLTHIPTGHRGRLPG